MTAIQKTRKLLYPLLMLFAPKKKFRRMLYNDKQQQPEQSFYELRTTTVDGNNFDFQLLKGKKVLIVNTASGCGFTPQLAELQSCYNEYRSYLQIIAFPSNDFKDQEKLTNSEITSYCETNYGISFPIMSKTKVTKGHGQNIVYQWLCSAPLNGWNDQAPDWNFSKYLIDEDGALIAYGGPAVSVKEMLSKIR